MSQRGDSLGDRMKAYEDCSRAYLTDRLPIIIRLDGKAFHTYTRGLERPYSRPLMTAMNEVTKYLCEKVQNCVMGYTQSDEISLLLVNFKSINTSAWFDNNLQKMVSISAGMASTQLTMQSQKLFGELRPACFDARAFVLPEHEASNYFVWRQKDWIRNSIQMLAQSLYSHKQLQGKGSADLHEMCFQKGRNWAAEDSHIKNGRICIKRQVEKTAGRPFPVTDDLDDAPDGAEVDGFRRVGGAWEPMPVLRSEWHIPAETPVFTENPHIISGLMIPDPKPGDPLDKEGYDVV